MIVGVAAVRILVPIYKGKRFLIADVATPGATNAGFGRDGTNAGKTVGRQSQSDILADLSRSAGSNHPALGLGIHAQ
jgi:hypothetical protein